VDTNGAAKAAAAETSAFTAAALPLGLLLLLLVLPGLSSLVSGLLKALLSSSGLLESPCAAEAPLLAAPMASFPTASRAATAVNGCVCSAFTT
jgi:hypothetical protein